MIFNKGEKFVFITLENIFLSLSQYRFPVDQKNLIRMISNIIFRHNESIAALNGIFIS
jgi:hypothetical protein